MKKRLKFNEQNGKLTYVNLLPPTPGAAFEVPCERFRCENDSIVSAEVSEHRNEKFF
jgi:hypothetical protein